MNAMRMHAIIAGSVLVAVALAGPALAATATWNVDGGGDWDDTTASNWTRTPAGTPVANDDVQLSKAISGSVTIDYASTVCTGTETVQGTRFGELRLTNSLGTTTLLIGSGDLLPCGAGVNKEALIQAGGRLEVTGGVFTPDRNLFVDPGGTVEQSGGLVRPRQYDLSLRGGVYRIVGGTAIFRFVGLSPSAGLATLKVEGGSLSHHNSSGTMAAGFSAGTSVVHQTGGTLGLNLADFTYGPRGQSLQEGGLQNHRTLFTDGGATLRQTGGTNDPAYELCMAGLVAAPYTGGAAEARFTLEGGTIWPRNLYIGVGKNGIVGGAGKFVLKGGACELDGDLNVFIGHASGTHPCRLSVESGGELKKKGSADEGVNITVHPNGTLGGSGGTLRGKNRTLTNNGRVEADGFGAAASLDLASYTAVANSSDNATDGTNGWYAVNRGQLLLPAVNFAATGADKTAVWGEAAADTTPDLVNSVLFTANVGTANSKLSGTLLASDRTDVPVGLNKSLAVWSISKTSGSFNTVALTFRYDHAKAAALGVNETSLQLYRHDGTRWVRLTATVDRVNKRIGSPVLTEAHLGLFAVAAPDNKGTAVLVK